MWNMWTRGRYVWVKCETWVRLLRIIWVTGTWRLMKIETLYSQKNKQVWFNFCTRYYLVFLFTIYTIMKKSEYMKLWEQFYKHFRRNLNDFVEMIWTEPELDIFKLDEFLHEKGYDDECSMKEFIAQKYWTEASEFIEYLLN